MPAVNVSGGAPTPPSPSPAGGDRPAETRTFLIADIRGYTTYTVEHGDAAAADLAGRFADLVREVVEAREGFLIELRGDEALVAFVSARQALRAALELQAKFAAAELPRGVGIGLDSGEAIPVGDGYRGGALNLAARLCAQAKAGQIIASEGVIHLAARVDGIAYVEARTLRLKGYDAPVRAVDVVSAAGAGARQTRRRGAGRGMDRRLLGAGVVAVVVVALVGAGLSGAFAPGSGSTPSPGGPLSAGGATPSHGSPSGQASTSVAQPTETGSATVGPSPSAAASASASPSSGQIAIEDLPLRAFMDPTTGKITDRQPPVPGQADAFFADGAFWVLGLDPKAFNRIDPATHKVTKSIAIPIAEEGWWTVANGTIWLTDLAKPRVVGIDTTTGALEHDYFLSDVASDTTPASGVAVGAGSL